VTEPSVANPVVKIEAIAEACRAMAALLVTPASEPEPSASELVTARAQLADARNAPGRIGWAVRIILEGATVGSRMDQAIDIVVRVAGYSTTLQLKDESQHVFAYRNVVHQLQHPRKRRGRGSGSNQPTLSKFN